MVLFNKGVLNSKRVLNQKGALDSKRGLGFERGLVVAVRIAEGGSKGGGPGGAGAPPGIKKYARLDFWIRGFLDCTYVRTYVSCCYYEH